MDMRLLVCLLLLLQVCHSAINTTDFWRRSLNLTDELHFQAFSGFEEIDWYHPRGKTGMHYQLFGAMGCSLNDSDAKVPLVLWLNGGPGSSSLFGAFGENGPIRIVNGTPVLFKYSWSLMAHMLFVDQPLNVGFSYDFGGRNPNSSRETATHLLNFLYNFYQEWPQLAASPLYIAGESFAGHYIPPFALAILNNATFQTATGCSLRGVALGNGWVDPVNQLNYYDSLLYSVGAVSNKFRDVCQWMQTQGLLSIYNGRYANATAYFEFLTNAAFQDTYLGGMDERNFRQYERAEKSFADFLQRNKDTFGVPKNINYNLFNPQVYEDFHDDIIISYTEDLVAVMREVRVLIYNGQEDYLVNTAGVLNYLNSLRWEGIAGWKRAKKQVWRINNQISGWAKTWGNLWFVLVNKAGHLVVTDKPQSAFNMMGHFLRNDGNWSQ